MFWALPNLTYKLAVCILSTEKALKGAAELIFFKVGDERVPASTGNGKEWFLKKNWLSGLPGIQDLPENFN